MASRLMFSMTVSALLLICFAGVANAAPITTPGVPEQCYQSMSLPKFDVKSNMCITITPREITLGVFRGEDDHCILGIHLPLV